MCELKYSRGQALAWENQAYGREKKISGYIDEQVGATAREVRNPCKNGKRKLLC